MEFAVSPEDQTLEIATTRSRAVARPLRCDACAGWLAGLALIVATAGCSRTSEHRQAADNSAARQEADAASAVEQPGDADAEQVDFLAPDEIPIPDLATVEQRRGKGIPDGALVLDLGGSVRSYAASLPFPVVVEQGQPLILLGEDKGLLWASGKFFNQAGKLICEIEKNELRVDDRHAFWTEATPHSLTLYENEAAEGEAKKDDAKTILSISFLNEKAVRLMADFYSPKGVHVVIGESGVVFGDRSLSATGLNGTGVNLDAPAAGVAQFPPEPAAGPAQAEDQPLVVAEAADMADAADVGAAMIGAAQAFLASLTPDEAAKARMKFDDPARLDWSNIPKKERKGLPILEMNPAQRKLCHQLVRSALSARATTKRSPSCRWKTTSARAKRT